MAGSEGKEMTVRERVGFVVATMLAIVASVLAVVAIVVVF